MKGKDPEAPQDENALIAERRAKLARLREAGVAFPNDFRRDALAADLHATYAEKTDEWLAANPVRVRVAGRMMFKRVMGKASFAKLQDGSGQIQAYLQADALGDAYDAFKSWDVGDIVGAEGTLMRTRAGELSVRAGSVRLLVKALRPLPDKWHGLADTETRYRQRYVDLIVNDTARETFRARSRAVRFLRDFLDALGFLEVETPMMQPIPGGAVARPFVTHHNALGQDMYLRIAPELYLKRLVVGGFERVYEINRNFRNEGLSTQHNPEFTMLELYQAYADYGDMMELTESMVAGVVQHCLETQVLERFDTTLDFTPPFPRVRFLQAVQDRAGLDLSDIALILPHNVNRMSWMRVLRRLRIRHFSGQLLDEPETIHGAARDAGIESADLDAWTKEPAVRQALREDMAAGRGEVAPCRWRHLPGAGRSAFLAPHRAGDALGDRVRAQAWREHHAAQAGRRTAGCLGKPRRRHQEA